MINLAIDNDDLNTVITVDRGVTQDGRLMLVNLEDNIHNAKIALLREVLRTQELHEQINIDEIDVTKFVQDSSDALFNLLVQSIGGKIDEGKLGYVLLPMLGVSGLKLDINDVARLGQVGVNIARQIQLVIDYDGDRLKDKFGSDERYHDENGEFSLDMYIQSTESNLVKSYNDVVKLIETLNSLSEIDPENFTQNLG
ncbi:MAG: hypothetical protein Q9M76_01875 [Candidatus Dojkabacteria bacterium]|nr:hypothetical protein [Candidatus Dojkabacteria bacterium]